MRPLLTILFLVLCDAALIRPTPSDKSHFTLNDVYRSLDALEKLLKYFDANRGSLIVDSMWGIRMIQGGLEDTLRSVDLTSDDLFPKVLLRISSISAYAREVSERGIFYAKRNAAVQFNKFSELLAKPFIYENLLSGSTGRVDLALVFNENSKLNIEPKDSDDCLMGTIGSGHYKGMKCSITEKCWRQITDKGQREYSITHQLLFFFLIKHYNCSEAIVPMGGDEIVAKLAQVFCTNIFSEMEAIFERGVDPGVDQDLVMEQVTFCGGAGFIEDFVRPSVLDMMLDWQRTDGCYAPYDGSHLPDAIALHSKRAKERSANRNKGLLRDVGGVMNPEDKFMMRKPLSEAELRDGCMMHMSSVAGGALTIYVRAVLKHKLYSPPHLLTKDQNLFYFNKLESYLVMMLACLTLVLLVKVGVTPVRCLKRLLGSLSRRNKQFYLI